MFEKQTKEQTKRLFIALELPAPIRLLLSERQKGLTNVNWAALDNLHLTLRFIGSVSLELTWAIAVALTEIDAKNFYLELNGLGIFERRPGAVLWASLAPSPALNALKRLIDEVLKKIASLKIPTELFRPHVTLGRMKRAERHLLKTFATESQKPLKAGFKATSFVLFSSLLRPEGAVYTLERRYLLKDDSIIVK
ncbi:MAG: RNA 2',3'-cyclic phosphodiesterase [Deltaproteobacteria bacterium]|jgi:2'-5' RNA ligase|nr:RNA 2',3'-cyclic phosphodiesterase [Deltaproteobacteria bacterium]